MSNAQLVAKITSMEQNISKLQNGKQTAKPKRKAEKRGARGVDLFYNGVYPTEFTSVTKAPQFSSRENGCSVISGREIVKTITSTFALGVAPAVTGKLEINFGEFSSPFKWLLNYARLYDLYKFRYLRVYFQPLLATTYSGAFGVYFDPENNDPTNLNFEDLSQNYGAKTCSIHQTLGLMTEYSKLNRLPWYTVTASDKVTGQVGVYEWIVTDLTAVTPIVGAVDVGFIWIEYSAEFKNPTNVVNT